MQTLSASATIYFWLVSWKSLPLLLRQHFNLFSADDRSLVIENPPAVAVSPPDGGAAGETAVLVEGVGEEVGFRAELEQAEVLRAPAGLARVNEVFRYSPGPGQNQLAAITAAGSADLPVAGRGGTQERLGGKPEGGCVEDRLAEAKFFENRHQLRIDMGKRISTGHSRSPEGFHAKFNCGDGERTSYRSLRASPMALFDANGEGNYDSSRLHLGIAEVRDHDPGGGIAMVAVKLLQRPLEIGG